MSILLTISGKDQVVSNLEKATEKINAAFKSALEGGGSLVWSYDAKDNIPVAASAVDANGEVIIGKVAKLKHNYRAPKGTDKMGETETKTKKKGAAKAPETESKTTKKTTKKVEPQPEPEKKGKKKAAPAAPAAAEKPEKKEKKEKAPRVKKDRGPTRVDSFAKILLALPAKGLTIEEIGERCAKADGKPANMRMIHRALPLAIALGVIGKKGNKFYLAANLAE